MDAIIVGDFSVGNVIAERFEGDFKVCYHIKRIVADSSNAWKMESVVFKTIDKYHEMYRKMSDVFDQYQFDQCLQRYERETREFMEQDFKLPPKRHTEIINKKSNPLNYFKIEKQDKSM